MNTKQTDMKPCKKCGTSNRDKWDHCRECERLRSINRRANQSETQREQSRVICASSRERRSKKIISSPCVKCGSPERNKSGDCSVCTKNYQKNWYQRNKASSAEYKKTWLLEHPDRAKEFDLRVRLKRYDLSVDEFQQMYIQQKGLCAICGRDLGRIDIDHDHKLGFVRGLLCHSCNIGLGAFQDSPAILSMAIQYLLTPRIDQVEQENIACTTT